MGIVFLGVTFDNVVSAQDRDTEEAIDYARDEIDGDKIRSALVDRYHGMILFEGNPKPGTKGYHLQTPLCGYEGDGPRAAAEILSRLGFGEQFMLYRQITNVGNDTLYRS